MNKDNNKEIEVKLLVADFSGLAEKIKVAGGVLLQPEFFQRTVRFDTPEQSLEANKTFLRVRTGDKNVVTLKRRIDGSELEARGLKEREEVETEVGDTEKVRQILNILGFTREFIMEKYRTDYHLDETVISLDRLPFGNFVEVEGEPEEIETTIQKIGLTEAERSARSYWGLFDEYKKKYNLSGENIVF